MGTKMSQMFMQCGLNKGCGKNSGIFWRLFGMDQRTLCHTISDLKTKWYSPNSSRFFRRKKGQQFAMYHFNCTILAQGIELKE